MFCFAGPAAAATAASGYRCGGDPAGAALDLFRHRQALLHRPLAVQDERPQAPPDAGNIAIVDDSEGVVVRPNLFDLAGSSLRLEPSGVLASQYTGRSRPLAFDADAVRLGFALTGLGDDDSRLVRLPFAFPFYGQRYDSVYINSDGNLTFTGGDNASSDRNLSRALAGPPRILPFFQDLDPSQPNAAVRYYAAPDRAVVTWDQVPQWTRFGNGARQTFQVAMYADGHIDFHYRDINISDGIVGIAPGGMRNGVTAAHFSAGVATATAGALAEIFSASTEIDSVAVSQKFYRSHDDAYDYVVVFNSMGLSLGPGVFAFESNVRNRVLGIGNILQSSPVFDFSSEFGSAVRLQSFLNMGPLGNFPASPDAVLPLFSSSRNTTLTILGQESGHRFLAYPRYLDPVTNQRSLALLGRQNAHWSYFFNSDASVVEGNRIVDLGEGQSPRFQTTATVEHYSALDQYLMGLRPASEVPPTFLVRNPSLPISPTSPPQAGRSFDGTRQDITVQMIIDAEGKRVPDAAVAQKHFNFAFILLVPAGTQPSADDVAQLERLRLAWEQFFNASVDNRGAAHTGLVKQLRLSTWPAGGVLTGSPASGTVTLAASPSRDLVVQLATSDAALITAPASVTIPAGRTSASFSISGIREGVAELTAQASDSAYEVSRTFVQVRADPSQLRLETVSGNDQQGVRGATLLNPVVFRLHDANDVPFSGVAVNFTASGDGAAIPPKLVTDADGRVAVGWRLATSGAANGLKASLDVAPTLTSSAIATGFVPLAFTAAGVVNAASFNTGVASSNTAIAPGGLITIFGASLSTGSGTATSLPLPTSLASTSVLMNGINAPLLYVSPGQINLQAPFELSGSKVDIVISNSAAGSSAPVTVPLAAVQPGIFFDVATSQGAVVHNSDGKLTSDRPARAGDFLQLYATGLGAVSPTAVAGFAAPSSPLSRTTAQPQLTIGGQPASVTFSGLAPGFAGLYQLTFQVPEGVVSGRQPLALTVNGLRANEVFVNIQ